MLLRVLRAVENADGPITLTELSRRMSIDPGALEGMLAYWAQRGRLVVEGRSAAACAGGCATAGCACGSCAGLSGCPFSARLPRAYAPARSTNNRDVTET